MPRNHDIWDAALGEQISIPFTPEEEIARDEEEEAERANQTSRIAEAASTDSRRTRITELLAVPRSGWTTGQLLEIVELSAGEIAG